MTPEETPVSVVWSAATRLHEPREEVWVGKPMPGTEGPERVDAILEVLADRRLIEAGEHSDEALDAVHDRALLDFLSGAHRDWMRGPYHALAGQDRVVPYVFPTPAMSQGMPPHPAAAAHGRVGEFCYDTMTLIGPGTWDAARAAAGCALTAVDLVLAGERAAYALCRPPGHHATRSGYGGSCYLNNAAIAAQSLRDGGHPRVAVLDIDAHHGNGTQAIFWERDDVCYASVHVDPGAGWFPHFFGYPDETGAGAGVGATRNAVVSEGTGDSGWLESIESLIGWIAKSGAGALVVSLGVDAAAEDPESPLLVTAEGYRRAGALTAAANLPTVVVQEGGYHLPTLGSLVGSYLDGLSS
ncbi:MAG: histone deacetylase family protein [Nocardioides sp.]